MQVLVTFAEKPATELEKKCADLLRALLKNMQQKEWEDLAALYYDFENAAAVDIAENRFVISTKNNYDDLLLIHFDEVVIRPTGPEEVAAYFIRKIKRRSTLGAESTFRTIIMKPHRGKMRISYSRRILSH